MAWEKTQSVRKPHVCICLPHYGIVTLEWVQNMWGPLRFIPVVDFIKSAKMGKGIFNLDTMRNSLVKYALEDKSVTHVLFLDTDNIAEDPADANQALRMLLSCDAPIASGLYRAKKKSGEYPYAMWMKNPKGKGYIGISKWTGNWVKVDVIGMGFCLIKREVFERVPYPWFVWDKMAPSEDFAFCEKLAKYGYEVRVLTDVKLSHAGMMKAKIDGSIHILDV